MLKGHTVTKQRKKTVQPVDIPYSNTTVQTYLQIWLEDRLKEQISFIT